ncbi:hypothetical protein LOK49_LG07G00146 [Camellia lanceoleosa]|uniref:Uncharacterized protein n=1 Tax=Camellia lanceoleosa TaxID=1840588 RepID=A0ACC0HAC2_9ERIC|nr:hypothetical protein LOK49_LG07G00146 [Camellia lanceoleosa]
MFACLCATTFRCVLFTDKAKIPHAFETSYAHSLNGFENMFMCTYPLFSTLVFAAFGIAYSLGFLFSYWRVISLVINKGTRVRIHILSFSIFIALPMQILLLTLSSFWRPENPAYGGVMFGMFLNVSLIAVVGGALWKLRKSMVLIRKGPINIPCHVEEFRHFQDLIEKEIPTTTTTTITAAATTTIFCASGFERSIMVSLSA